MAKRKHFKKYTRTYSGRQKSFIKNRGGYLDQFSAGRRASLQNRFNRLVNFAASRQLSAWKKRYRTNRQTARQVNEKLLKLKRWGRYDTWASKQLISKLNVSKLKLIDNNGLINMDNLELLNVTQMTNMEKAMQQFINSKTSTIQGINAVVRRKRQDLIQKSDNPQWVKSLTNKEIEDIYRVFDDDEFSKLSEYIKYSDVFEAVIEAKQDKMNIDEFKEELQKYLDPSLINDDDVLNSMESIYNKYVNNEE